jgi:hypothetical protein
VVQAVAGSSPVAQPTRATSWRRIRVDSTVYPGMVALRALVAALALTLAACSDDESPAPPAPTTVRGSLYLERIEGGGPPDAPTQAGYGADSFVVRTHGPRAIITGTVRPAAAGIRLMDRSGRRTARVNVAPDGRFRAALADLPRGKVVIFDLTATLPGARPWKARILGARSSVRGVFTAPDLVVPQQDSTPPTAVLLLRADARFVTSISPARPGKEPPVRLRSPAIALAAVVHDDDGGTGRIRASLTYIRECRDPDTGRRTTQRATRYFPPSEIAGVKLPPGRRAPVERVRRAAVRLPTQPDCVIRGKAWADATNASGLESFSDQVPFVFRADRSQ